MKLCNLLDIIEGSTVIWIAKEDDPDGLFHGFAEDAEDNIANEVLFGDVTAVYAEYYQSYIQAGISILVKPYQA